MEHDVTKEVSDDQRQVAMHILQRLGEGGQPPEYGLHRINVGNESYLRVLEDEYFRGQLRVGSSFKLVQGYFGGGKTHFLFCVRALAWSYDFVTALVELSPAECPYDDALKVYQAVARRIVQKPEHLHAPPAYGIGTLLRNLVDRHVQRVQATAPNPGPKAKLQAHQEVEAWLTRTVGRAWCESHSFRQAITHFALAYLRDDIQAEQKLEAWLLGENIAVAQLRDFGVYEQMGRANAFTMLRSLLQMIVALGLPGTALLFDEVDRNLSVSAKRSHIIGDNLRQVVDLCGRHQLPNTLFMYAVPPEFMRTVVPDYPALYQRLKSPVPLSVRSPQAVLIDLEKLDLAPADLLESLGKRLVEVFEDARGCQLDRAIQQRNARVLAEVCAEAFFEVNHRRLFVKTWVDFLFHQLVDASSELSHETARELIRVGHQDLINVAPSDDFSDF